MSAQLSLSQAQQLLNLFQDMHTAACDNDWARLAELESDSASLCRTAQSSATEQPLSPQQQLELASTLEAVLALERKIREHVEPALTSTRKLLSSSVQSRAVHNTYTSLGG